MTCDYWVSSTTNCSEPSSHILLSRYGDITEEFFCKYHTSIVRWWRHVVVPLENFYIPLELLL